MEEDNTDAAPEAKPFYSGLFSAIVPCRDEEESIPVFYGEFISQMAKMGNPQFEIIFVEDGSKDRTLEALKELSESDNRVRFISFSRNFGKEAAMYAGMKEARGDYIAVMDCDLQDPPSLLPDMFKALDSEGYDCAAARRITRDGEPPVRSFAVKCFYRILNSLSPLKFAEGARDFRLMRRRTLETILSMPEYNRFTKGMYEWIGGKTKWIEYPNAERRAGRTKWSIWGLAIYSLDALTSFSTVPLALAAVLGIAFCALSAVAIVFLSIRQMIFHNSAYGWTSMVCILFFLSGLQLFCLGVLGHYMSKIYLESKRRPHYVVSERSKER